MALLAALVIFTVIARYCFSLSWKQLAEFNTTLFAFTTFWGMGINVIKDEHVMIDILYDGVKPARKRWLAIVNYLIVLAVVLVFTYQGFKYVGVAGKQISQGMEIPMMYMYGIMPVCGIICAICVVIKIITLYKADISYFAPKNQALSRDDAQAERGEYTTMAMLILLVLLIFFAALGIPLAFAIGASCVTYILIYAPTFITMLPQRVWNGAYSELMIAMPLFMLAGELMNTGGITQRIINFCMELLRPIRGGLGEVNIVASMIFGGISGSSVADTSALGSILIPAMEKEGYPPEASAGITVASSTMGMIIPPSTPMIVYSMISGASVGALFVAGAVPGILIGLTQLVLVYIISAKKGWHPEKIKFDGKRAAKSLLSGIPALIMPLFIIICVSFGVCTASESAGVAVLYSMLVGFFVYKELTWKGVWEALKKTLISSSSIMLIIGFTTIFTWVLTMQKVPQTVGAFFMSLNMPAWAIALIFDVLILMIGTFIDVSPAILLLTPILLPVMVQYGFSPLQFGAMMITGLAIGLVTPPVGMCLNACNKINRMPIIEIFKGAAPYVICNVIVLISISLWGPLTTALPQLLGYSIF